MSLVPDYADSSSDYDEYTNQDQQLGRKSGKTAPLEKLPKPNFFGTNTVSYTSSVFKNPFVDAENAKEAILQKHVKMVNSKDNVDIINGKKICWNYRKGRCRFGHNCRFAHDSDIQKSKDKLKNEKEVQQTVNCQKQILPQTTALQLESISHQESVLLKSQKNKKRPGLTQGLVPGKKVMKSYINQK